MPRVDFVEAAKNYLMSQPVFVDLVTNGYIGADSPGEGPHTSGWCFHTDLEPGMIRDVEGTETSALAIHSYDSWTEPTRWHSSLFPRLSFTIVSDVSRDPEFGSPTKRDADDKVRYIYSVLNPLFHDSANNIHSFNGFPVISTVASGGLSIRPVPKGDGMVRGDFAYDLHLHSLYHET